MSYSRITVDLTPPQPPTYLEETLAPFISWGGYFIEQLSSAPSTFLCVVGRIGSCAMQTLKTTKDTAIDCLIEISPVLITYGTHELIEAYWPDQPIAMFAQGCICYASSKCLFWRNEIPSLERVRQGVEHELQKLYDEKKRKPTQSLVLAEVQIYHKLPSDTESMPCIRPIMGISLNIFGICYVAHGAYLALNKIYG